jgi:hypothetical protein
MKINIKDYLVDNPKKSSITKIFHSKLQGNIQGELVVFMSIKASEGVDAVNLTSFIVNGVSMGIRKADTPVNALRQGLAKGEEHLSELIKNDKTAQEGVDARMVLLILQEHKASVGLFGENFVNLYHQGQFVNVTKILKDNNVMTCSLPIAQEDFFLVSNSQSFIEEAVNGADSSEEAIMDIDSSAAVLDVGEGAVLLSNSIDFDKILATPPELDEDSTTPKSIESEETTEKEKSAPDSVNQRPDPSLVSESSSITSNSTEPEKSDAPDSLESDAVKETTNETHSDNAFSKESLMERSSSIANSIGTSTNKVSELKKKISPALDKGKELTGGIFEKVKPIKSSLAEKVSNTLENKVGRKRWFKRLKAKLSQSRIGRASISKLKVGEYREKNQQKSRIAKAAVVLVLIIGLYGGWTWLQNQRYRSELHEEFNTVYTDVSASLDSAESKVNSNVEEAELALFKAEKTWDQTELDFDNLSKEDKKKLNQLEERFQTISDKISKVFPLSETEGNIELFVDARVDLNTDAELEDIAILQNSEFVEHIYLTDPGSGSVYKVETVGSNVGKVSDSNSILSSPKYIDVGILGIYVYDSESGAVTAPFQQEDDTKIGAFQKLSGLTPEQIDASSVEEFAILTSSDNVYLLSQDQSAILKSQKSFSGGYGLPYVYLNDPSLSTANDFFADFNIYVISEGANGFNRYRFSSENNQLVSFPVEFPNFRGDFGNLTAGYTGASLDDGMYLFDSVTGRIMIFEKPNESEGKHPGEMILIKQLEYRGGKDKVFNNVKDLVVDANEEFLYIVDGTKVWRVTL